MSVLETRGYYQDNGDYINNRTGNRVTMKTDAKLLEVHWQNSELAGLDMCQTCEIWSGDLNFDGNGAPSAGTMLSSRDFWMDDIANLYADWNDTDPDVPVLQNGHDYYILGNSGATNNFDGVDFGNTFYPDDGSNPFPQNGTYLNWTGACWGGGIWDISQGWAYMFNVIEITLELITAAVGHPRRIVRIANSPRLTVQRVRR